MAATSATRVPRQTDAAINERIRRQAEADVAYCAARPGEVGRRLRELDEEWDVERALETGSSVLSLAGLVLGMARGRRRWLLLPLAVQGFFLQHALQGWCPPLPVFRRLGFRTRREIDEERYALKVIRGDFREAEEPGRAMEAVRRG